MSGETLHGGEWSVALPNCITPEEINSWTGGWVGLGVCLDFLEKRKISASAENRTPIHQPYSS